MYIRNLIENTCSNSTLHSEHGLSFYIETKKHKILFDTGASDSFAKNAQILGIDLSRVDVVVLSHGHYDHGGGLRKFLECNHTARIYIRKEAFGTFYAKDKEGLAYIGIDQELRNHPQIEFVSVKELIIDEELYLFAGVKERNLFPKSNQILKEEIPSRELVQDSFGHEQNLVIREGEEETLFCGCAHNGMVNVLKRYDEVSKGCLVKVIGGMHLMNPNTSKSTDHMIISALAEALMQRKNARYYTCHCTGVEAFTILHTIMGDQITYISTGEELYARV